jgi:hypothetical protein
MVIVMPPMSGCQQHHLTFISEHTCDVQHTSSLVVWRAEDGRKGRGCFRRAVSGRRKGRFCIWWHGGWFEAVNGDSILFWTYLKEEGMR